MTQTMGCMYDAVEYLMDGVIKEFIDECFIKYIIFK